MEVYGAEGFRKELDAGDCIITLTDMPMGKRTSENTIYTEISIRRNDIMNEAVKAGENFHFAKAGLHSVKATKRFKMALLLTLE